MKRRETQEEEEKGYSWQDTYGDLVTLLLCFFVLLYSFSSIDAEKWKELVGAFSGTSGDTEVTALDETSIRNEAIQNIDSMVDKADRSETEKQENASEQEVVDIDFNELYKNLTTYVSVNNLEGQISVIRDKDAIIIRFNEVALFNSGEAEVLPEDEGLVQHIITMISENISAIRMINIEGHTDNMPIHNEEFADNWDLSTKRATNMLRLVVSSGLIDVNKLSAIGYGEYHPVASNDTAEGRAQNRRVDFVLNKMILSN